MAVTHADLAIKRSCSALGSKLATCVMILCAFLGLLAFVFGFVAEITRTQAIWISVEMEIKDSEDIVMKCMYTSDGRSPFVAALGSLLSLVMAMGIYQAYMCMALRSAAANHQSPPLASWTQSDPGYYQTFRWQAAAYFVLSWVSFAVAAVLLIVGVAVEAGHTERWSVGRDKCMVVRVGVFAAAGVVGLFATSMGIAFYVSAVQTERLVEEEAHIRREVVEATVHYTSASPAPSSIQQIPNK
ncbi:hypothetical protein KI387_010756 [Taxus chinensis]|uniref:Transmembrane protein n=1 Tax=Taxus chinensis TaxID=29808 RepID=A0AA38KWN0_TAXCH|nr:hypothetical protein KI387_010756 [Taxus chinensis]